MHLTIYHGLKTQENQSTEVSVKCRNLKSYDLDKRIQK